MSKEVAFTMRAITASVPLAAAGEVLVTNSVVDLVEGAGIAFVDRGAHTLKGVPDPSQLWAVAGE
jgi:class 3 adenylate cyclase